MLIFRVEMMEAHVESVDIRHTERFIRLSIPESSLLSVLFSQTQLNLPLNQQNTKTKKNKFKLNLFIYFQNHQIFKFASLSFLMEFEIDDNSNGEPVGNATMGEVSSSIADKDIVDCSSLDPTDEQDQDDNMTQDSSGADQIPSAVPPLSVVRIEEPYLGQEFVSEAEAHAFYNAYATRVGFVIRVSKLSRSRRDGSVIGRALVCNKEGFRMPDKREKIVRQRAETRVGCRAMIMVRKLNSGLWSITKFVKEHTHPLTPGRGRRDFVYEQYPSGHDRVRELSQQLDLEKKRTETYKRNLELLYEYIEEHNETVSKQIQQIVESVKEVEAKEQENPR